MKNLILAFLFLSCSSVFSQERILFLTQQRAPYGYKEDGELKGPFLKVVQCVMERLNIPYDIKIVPWARAQYQVKSGEADAFFAGSESDRRRKYSEVSDLFGRQNWSWFYLKGTNVETYVRGGGDIYGLKVAAYAGSNMLKTLNSLDYNVTFSPLKPRKLIDGLLTGRAQIILANDVAFEKLLKEADRIDLFGTKVFKKKSLGVHFSKITLKKYPNFLGQFNQNLKKCFIPGADGLLREIEKPTK